MNVLTAPVRLVLGFLALYILASVLIFGYLYTQLSAALTAQIDKALLDQQRLLVMRYHDYGRAGLRRAIENQIASRGRGEWAYRIVDAEGKVAFEAGGLVLPQTVPGKGVRDVEVDRVGPSPGKRRARVLSFALPGGPKVFIGIDTRQAGELKQEFRHAFMRTGILVVLLGAAGSLWFARRFQGRIEAFSQLARRIVKSGDLSSRMPVQGNDEFATLALNVNAMLERIERLVQGIRQVSDNIAHDLRSPLTRLRADVEVALQQNDPATDRATLERVLSELGGMQTIFNSLLSLGQAEAGGMRLKRKRLDLSAFLAEMVELYSPSAEERELELAGEIAPGLAVFGDRQLLAQALSNLLDNALKYVPAGGTILLRAARAGSAVEILLEDSGPGIAPEMREKIFERFTRIDPSRTLPGTGLGLALVKAFVELHGGSVRAAESALGGAAFKVELPAA